MRARELSPFVGLLLLSSLVGCFEDPVANPTTSDAGTTGDGDGDVTDSGDGDGDPTDSGDGDGDPTDSGDGDGDPTDSGDGDGDNDSESGDGDGDPVGSAGDYLWSVSFPGFPVGIGPYGEDMLLVANLREAWQGPDEVIVPDGSDILLLAFTAAGETPWARAVGGPAGDFAVSAAFYGDQRVAASAIYAGDETTYGGPTFPPGNNTSALVGFSGPQAEHAWSLPVVGNFVPGALDVDGALNVLLTGRGIGSITLDGLSTNGAPSNQVVFGRMGTTGDNLSVTALREYGEQMNFDEGMFAKHDGLGGIYIGGRFEGTTDLDGEQLVSEGERNAFIARVAINGDVEWVAQISSPENIGLAPTAMATDASGRLLVGGSFQQAIRYNGQGLGSDASGKDAFVLRIDSQGTLSDYWLFTSPGDADVRAIDVASNGDLLIGGEAAGGLQFGDTSLAGVGGIDAVLMRLDESGQELWSGLYGSGSDDRVNAVAFDPQDRPFAGISYLGNLELGEGVLLENDSGEFWSALVAFE